MLPSLRFEMHVIEKMPLANFDPKTAGSFGSRPEPGYPVWYYNIVGTLKILLWPSHIGQVLYLSRAVSWNLLHTTFLQITLAAPEVVGTESWITRRSTTISVRFMQHHLDAVIVTSDL